MLDWSCGRRHRKGIGMSDCVEIHFYFQLISSPVALFLGMKTNKRTRMLRHSLWPLPALRSLFQEHASTPGRMMRGSRSPPKTLVYILSFFVILFSFFLASCVTIPLYLHSAWHRVGIHKTFADGIIKGLLHGYTLNNTVALYDNGEKSSQFSKCALSNFYPFEGFCFHCSVLSFPWLHLAVSGLDLVSTSPRSLPKHALGQLLARPSPCAKGLG